MPRKSQLLAALFAALLPLAAAAAADSTAPRKTLRPFASEQELAQLFDKWAEERKRRRDELHARQAYGQSIGLPGDAGDGQGGGSDRRIRSPTCSTPASTRAASSSCTATSRHPAARPVVHSRRSRRHLKPVSMRDAFGSGIDPRGAWYDEMLISGNTDRRDRLQLRARRHRDRPVRASRRGGELSYRATYHLRSNDYYSSRNYASRLIGSKLVFYTPLYLNPWQPNPYAQFPACRRVAQAARAGAEFKRIAPATRIYRSDEPLDPWQGVALHTVHGVRPRQGRARVREHRGARAGRARVLRLARLGVRVERALGGVPHPARRRRAERAQGRGQPGRPVLVPRGRRRLPQRDGARQRPRRGDVVERSAAAANLALLRVHALDASPTARDSRAAEQLSAAARPSTDTGFRTAIVGAATCSTAGARSSTRLRYADGASFGLPLAARGRAHRSARRRRGGDRQRRQGPALHRASASRPTRSPPAATRAPVRAQGETRSHGFFYSERRWPARPADPRPGRTHAHQLRDSASLLYLRNANLAFSEIGTLDSQPGAGLNDGCRASCVDWYGNSRPLFLQRRVFALMGYEIVEGRLAADKIVESRRVNFAPGAFDR